MTSVLITGASGCVGYALTKMLARSDFDVIALDLKSVGTSPIRNISGIRIICGDFTDVNVLHSIFNEQRIDVVVHLAAIVHKSNASSDDFFAVNYSATVALFELSRAYGVRHFVFVSTVAVFGNKNDVLDEESECFPVTPYAESKLAAEKFIRESGKSGTSYTIIRPTTIYGKYDQGNIARLLSVVNMRILPVVGDGNTLKSLVYVENVTEGISRTILNPDAFGQVFILSDKQPYTMNQIIQEMKSLTGKKVLIVRLPSAIIIPVLKKLDYFFSRFFKKKIRIIDTIRNSANESIYNISKSEKILSYAPKFGLKEGLRLSYGK